MEYLSTKYVLLNYSKEEAFFFGLIVFGVIFSGQFWRAVFGILEDVPKSPMDWSEKLGCAYAVDLIAVSLSSRSTKSSPLPSDVIDAEFSFYVSNLLPRICTVNSFFNLEKVASSNRFLFLKEQKSCFFQHLLKEAPKLLRDAKNTMGSVRVLTRFFTSWSSLHLLTFKQVFSPSLTGKNE